ncbi:MAG: glycosyltransferase [Alphaproteobacteria bacterium]|jgi:glycosyltransferase involved in cell wall biosynthesis|nr:glycosyltransferase [Alphaproteobacteria bacterium]
MRIAFYAPMKAPDHPVPSGDRRMARLFMRVLAELGHEVRLVSRFRSWDDGSCPQRMERLAGIGPRLAERLKKQLRSAGWIPDLWFTYHLYYKAPDWLGPAVAGAFGIPYLIAEASYAGKRAAVPTVIGHDASTAAIRRADAVLALSGDDADGLAALVPGERLVRVGPFLDHAPFSEAAATRQVSTHDVPRLLAVAMMRPGDKLASYRLLGEALSLLADRAWSLTVVGDGPARAAVSACLPTERTRFLGQVAADDLPDLYASADLFVWPAIREAYGLALLEAQATGLPAVVGRTGGTPDIVREGVTGLLPPVGDAAALADAVRLLLDDPDRRVAMGRAALRTVASAHSLDQARSVLAEVIGRVCR